LRNGNIKLRSLTKTHLYKDKQYTRKNPHIHTQHKTHKDKHTKHKNTPQKTQTRMRARTQTAPNSIEVLSVVVVL